MKININMLQLLFIFCLFNCTQPANNSSVSTEIEPVPVIEKTTESAPLTPNHTAESKTILEETTKPELDNHTTEPKPAIKERSAPKPVNNVKKSQQILTPAEETPNSDLRNTMLRLVNEIRQEGCKCGRKNYLPVGPLTWSNQLEKSAQQHANDMESNEHFDHTGTDGSNAGERISGTGYDWRTYGENIAWGYNSVASVVQGWKESTGHCKNMMNGDFTQLGAAENNSYWVQNFARPK